MADKATLPHDLDAEKSTLGAVVAHGELWPVVASLVAEDDFFREQHRAIFAAVRELAARGSAIDPLLVVAELRRLGRFEAAGGIAYVASLADGVPKSTNVQHYAAVVKEHAQRRAAIGVANAVLDAAYAAERRLAEVVDDGVSALARCVSTAGAGLTYADAEIRSYASALVSGDLPKPVPTGYVDLDRVLRGGVRPGDLVIVAARPSVGKTSWAFGALNHMAHEGRRVLVFPIETGRENVAAKVLSMRANVPSARIEANEASPEEWQRVAAALEADSKLFVIQDSARTVTEVGAWARRVKDDGGLDVLAVDYLQLLVPERETDNESRDVAGISRALKRIAKELRVGVVALSQLSRSPEARRDKRPQLSDLRSSGALEQDADVVVLLHREEMHKATDENAGVAECIVAKQRNGPTGVVRLAWRSEVAQFANLAA